MNSQDLGLVVSEEQPIPNLDGANFIFCIEHLCFEGEGFSVNSRFRKLSFLTLDEPLHSLCSFHANALI